MSKRLLIHVGCHKTGTTWLQRGLFSQHPELQLVSDFEYPWRDPLLDYIVRCPPSSFDARRGRALLIEAIETAGVRDHQCSVISAERLSGHPISGGFDRETIAERLNAIAPWARIVIGIRNQGDLLESLYRQLVAEGFPGRKEALLKEANWKAPYFSLAFLDFTPLVKRYMRLFGADQVLVLPFGLLRSDPTLFCSKLLEFARVAHTDFVPTLGVTNASLSDAAIGAMRELNKFRRSEYNRYPIVSISDGVVRNVGRIVNRFTRRRRNSDAPAATSATILDTFAKSNADLQKLLDLPLSGRW